MRRLSHKDRLGMALVTSALIVLAGLFGMQAALSERNRRIDRADIDPTLPSPRSTLLLVDVTDPLDAAQGEAVRERVGELVEFELQRGELMGVCSIGQYADGDVRSWFSARAPDREVNSLVQTPSRRVARVDSIFTRPLHNALDQALRPSTADRTRLAASIREATELEGFGHEIPTRHLVVVSDLLENGPDISLYRARLDSSLAVPPGWLRVNRADLQGVAVEVLEIPRPGIAASGRSAIRRFWTTYFDSCGAGSVGFRRLP